MEELKTYLESGILEQYVLGDLSKEEMIAVEKNALRYPEIRTEISEIGNALLCYAKSNSIEPSAAIRNRILNSLDNSDQDIQVSRLNPSTASPKSSAFYKYAFAASLAFLFLSIILLIDSELTDTRNALQFHQNPAAYKLVSLKGSAKAPSASMLLAFNAEKEELMIDLSSLNMPTNDQKHQYQLWAMVDGKPVDLGVFDSEGGSIGMKKMKSVKNAQSFAVTLELRGGSVNPTMDQMMAFGSI